MVLASPWNTNPDGQWSETEVGTPQGAVVSPLLANVYLHYVFDLWVDLWVEVWRKKVAKGDVIAVRYADDLVLDFNTGRTPSASGKSFGNGLAKFGLSLAVFTVPTRALPVLLRR